MDFAIYVNITTLVGEYFDYSDRLSCLCALRWIYGCIRLDRDRRL